MSWVSCYEASEPDARLVSEGLQDRAVPCRVLPAGSSMFPSRGFQVLVPADRLEDARGIVDDALAASNDPATPAWRCAHCGEGVDGELDACWSCGRKRDGGQPVAIERVSLAPAREPQPKLPVFRTFWYALRLTAAHPTIFAPRRRSSCGRASAPP